MASEETRIQRLREENRRLLLVAIILLIVAGIGLEIRDPGFWMGMVELLSNASQGLALLP